MRETQVVVTGAAGFIGSRLLADLALRYPAAALLAVDHPVTEAKRGNLEAVPGVAFLGHLDFVASLESGALAPELILHMGACSSTTETDWGFLAENNLRYSQRIWSWCANRGSRLIYASSAATYGDGSGGFDDELPIGRLHPLNLYGRSKHEFDLWVEAQVAEGRPGPAQSVGLKFFNVFGYGEAHKGRMASMVLHGFEQIQSSGTVKLFRSHRTGYPDGGQLRDFISVGDVVKVTREIESRPSVSGLYNLGTGTARTFRDLIEAVFSAMGIAPRIEYVPMPDDLQGRYQYFTEARMRKLGLAGIPYEPTPMLEAVAGYIDGLRSRCV